MYGVTGLHGAIRERDVFSFAEIKSGFKGKPFQEELRRGTVLCMLSNLVFPNNPIKLAPRSTNSDSQRGQIHWSSLLKQLKRLGIPLSLVDKPRIEQGDVSASLTALILFYFLYHLTKANDFSAEFSFDVPAQLTQFLQSFESVRALVIGGAVSLRAVPEPIQTQLRNELMMMEQQKGRRGDGREREPSLNGTEGGSTATSRASSVDSVRSQEGRSESQSWRGDRSREDDSREHRPSGRPTNPHGDEVSRHLEQQRVFWQDDRRREDPVQALSPPQHEDSITPLRDQAGWGLASPPPNDESRIEQGQWETAASPQPPATTTPYSMRRETQGNPNSAAALADRKYEIPIIHEESLLAGAPTPKRRFDTQEKARQSSRLPDQDPNLVQSTQQNETRAPASQKELRAAVPQPAASHRQDGLPAAHSTGTGGGVNVTSTSESLLEHKIQIVELENEDLRTKLAQVLSRFNRVEAELKQSTDREKELRSAGNDEKHRADDLAFRVAELEESLRNSEEVRRQNEDRLKDTVGKFNALRAEKDQLLRNCQQLEAQLQAVAFTKKVGDSLNQLNSLDSSPTPARDRHSRTTTGHSQSPTAETPSAVQQVLLAEQQSVIEELRLALQKAQVENDQLTSTVQAMQQHSTTLNLSALTQQPSSVGGRDAASVPPPAQRALFTMQSPQPRASSQTAVNIGPSPSPQNPRQGTSSTPGLASPGQRAGTESMLRRDSQGRFALPTTAIFVRDPSTLPRWRGKSTSTEAAAQPTFGYAAPSSIRLADLPDDDDDEVDVAALQGTDENVKGMIQVNPHDLAADIHQAILQLTVDPIVANHSAATELLESMRSKLWLLLSSVHVLESRVIGAAEALQTLESEKSVTMEQCRALKLTAENLKMTLQTKEHSMQRESTKADIRSDTLQSRLLDSEAEVKRLRSEVDLLKKKQLSALEVVAAEEERRMDGERQKRRVIQQKYSIASERDHTWRELCALLTQLNEITLHIAAADSQELATMLASQRADVEVKIAELTQRVGQSLAEEQALRRTSNGKGDNQETGGDDSNGNERFAAEVSAALKQMMRDAVAEKEEVKEQLNQLRELFETHKSDTQALKVQFEAEKGARKSLETRNQQLQDRIQTMLNEHAASERENQLLVDSLKSQVRELKGRVKEVAEIWSVQPPEPVGPSAAAAPLVGAHASKASPSPLRPEVAQAYLKQATKPIPSTPSIGNEMSGPTPVGGYSMDYIRAASSNFSQPLTSASQYPPPLRSGSQPQVQHQSQVPKPAAPLPLPSSSWFAGFPMNPPSPPPPLTEGSPKAGGKGIEFFSL